MRAGSFALSLLGEPLQVRTLTALGREALTFRELCERIGYPPRSTAYRHLGALLDIGVLSSHRLTGRQGNRSYTLTQSGRELTAVAKVLRAWLAESPKGPIPIGSAAAKSTVKALDDAWCSAIVRALSVRSLTLTELNVLIADLSYPQLERRLAAMRRSQQIEVCPHNGAVRGRTPYTATRWLKRGLAPLVSAIRWERVHLPVDTTSTTRMDFETIFLLAVPALALPPDATGSCQLIVEVERGSGRSRSGVHVEVNQGQVVSCSSRLTGSAPSSATAPPEAWLRTIARGIPRGFAVRDRGGLAPALVEGLHRFLFASKIATRS